MGFLDNPFPEPEKDSATESILEKISLASHNRIIKIISIKAKLVLNNNILLSRGVHEVKFSESSDQITPEGLCICGDMIRRSGQYGRTLRINTLNHIIIVSANNAIVGNLLPAEP